MENVFFFTSLTIGKYDSLKIPTLQVAPQSNPCKGQVEADKGGEEGVGLVLKSSGALPSDSGVGIGPIHLHQGNVLLLPPPPLIPLPPKEGTTDGEKKPPGGKDSSLCFVNQQEPVQAAAEEEEGTEDEDLLLVVDESLDEEVEESDDKLGEDEN